MSIDSEADAYWANWKAANGDYGRVKAEWDAGFDKYGVEWVRRLLSIEGAEHRAAATK